MIKTILRIEGMMCPMCEAHICDTIRKAIPGAKKVSATRGKNEASFLADAPVDFDPESSRQRHRLYLSRRRIGAR